MASVDWDPARLASYQALETGLTDLPSGSHFSTIRQRTLAAYAASWVDHANRRFRRWPWASIIHDIREADEACFEVAIWCDDVLCGLAAGEGRAGDYCSARYVEGSPDIGHPLRRRVVDIAVKALELYAVAIGRRQIRLVRPNAWMQTRCVEIGFSLENTSGREPYLFREVG